MQILLPSSAELSTTVRVKSATPRNFIQFPGHFGNVFPPGERLARLAEAN